MIRRKLLPFTNETEVEGLDKLARESFYEYFSVRPFHDVEIEETDEIIRMLENAEEKKFIKYHQKNWENSFDVMPWFMEGLQGLKGFFSLSTPRC